MNNQKRLYRSTQDRMFAGVCGGFAEYLDVDPTLVRLMFVALTLMGGGAGITIYVVLMLVVPEDPGPLGKRKRDMMYLDDEESTVVQSDIPVPPDDSSSLPSDDVESNV